MANYFSILLNKEEDFNREEVATLFNTLLKKYHVRKLDYSENSFYINIRTLPNEIINFIDKEYSTIEEFNKNKSYIIDETGYDLINERPFEYITTEENNVPSKDFKFLL